MIDKLHSFVSFGLWFVIAGLANVYNVGLYFKIFMWEEKIKIQLDWQ